MEANGSGLEAAGIRDYLGWLVRRWWIVAIATVIGGVAALGYVSTQPKVYVSDTPVIVLAPYDDGAKVNLDDESNILQSATVATGAQNLLKTRTSVSDLLQQVNVTVPPNTSVMDIKFSAATPAEAALGSQAFAQAYLDQRSATAATALDQQMGSLQDRIKALQTQLDAVAGQVAALPPGSSALEKAKQNQQLLSQQVTTLTNQLAPLQSIVVKPGSILSPASVPKRPAKPNVPLYLISGVAVGLVLGLALALAMARLDTRIYRADDVPERPDVPVLLEIRPGRQRPKVADAATGLGREFSLLRNVLRFAAGTARGGRPSATDTLLVCGAVPGPATGFVVANLAAAFARAGERVAIVCTDPDSTLPEVLGVRSDVGLGEVLAGEIELGDALLGVPSLRDVSVLTSGLLDPRVELPVAAVSELLRELQQRTDRVLIAAAPPSRAVDAQALSEVAAAVLLVVETRRVHVPEIESALDQFARVYAPVAGMLVVTDHWKTGRSDGRLAKRAAAVTARPAPLATPLPPTAERADRPVSPAPTESNGSVTPPRQFVGWQGRTRNDQTVVLPKLIDVGDPPEANWPEPAEAEEPTSLLEPHVADKR